MPAVLSASVAVRDGQGARVVDAAAAAAGVAVLDRQPVQSDLGAAVDLEDLGCRRRR